MSTFTTTEPQEEVTYIYTSGTGIHNIIGAGRKFCWIIWENNGNASGVTVSILDTVSGTAASGLWVTGSGCRHVSFNAPIFTSGMLTNPIRVEYFIDVNSGLAIMISGGAANAVRAGVAFVS